MISIPKMVFEYFFVCYRESENGGGLMNAAKLLIGLPFTPFLLLWCVEKFPNLWTFPLCFHHVLSFVESLDLTEANMLRELSWNWNLTFFTHDKVSCEARGLKHGNSIFVVTFANSPLDMKKKSHVHFSSPFASGGRRSSIYHNFSTAQIFFTFFLCARKSFSWSFVRCVHKVPCHDLEQPKGE